MRLRRLLCALKHQAEIKTEKTGTGNHIRLIGADHLHSEDESKAKERLAGLAVSPSILDKILGQEPETRYMPSFLICDFICSSEEEAVQ